MDLLEQALANPNFQEQRRSFLRIVSHELRTPLNSILGFSEILATELYGPLGAPQYLEYADIIRRSGSKLLMLVNQVIEIVRWQTGDVEIDLQPELLAPIVDEQRIRLASALSDRKLTLQVGQMRRMEALADARALRLVISHLLQNAVTFAPEGGEVRIVARTHAEGLALTIANDGDGVSPDDLERLRRPFEQGANALTRQAEGAGLGLSICDLACRAMGGRLDLISAPGQGFSADVILRRPRPRTVAESRPAP